MPEKPLPCGKIHSVPSIPDHTLIRRIGEGSYGEVWLARNILGTARAVKVIYRDAFDHDRPYEREFSGIRKFEPICRSHEGFVDILQLGRNESEGYFYYVMEAADDADPGSAKQEVDSYCPRTLRTELNRHARLPVEDCLDMAIPMTEALRHLHAHGLVHRDIKPSNIIFVGNIPKLADIGLVAGVGETKSYVGTEGFIPPEGPGSPQADLYSLGKVLYELCTGKDRNDYPELPSEFREGAAHEVLSEFNEIILRACMDDPRLRYQSAGEMHSDLTALRKGRSVRKRRAWEWRVSILGRAGAAALAVLILWAAAVSVNISLALALLSLGALAAASYLSRSHRRALARKYPRLGFPEPWASETLWRFRESVPLLRKSRTRHSPAAAAPAATPAPEARGDCIGAGFVGRREELQLLRGALEKLSAGRGAVVTVRGEAGIGKSRLVMEARAAGTTARNQVEYSTDSPVWLEGRCQPYAFSMAFYPWLDLLRTLLGVAVNVPGTSVREILKMMVEGLCPERADAVFPYIARLLSLAEEDAGSLTHDLSGERFKMGAFAAVELLLERAALQRPLVLFMEDIHWIDPTSLELLARVFPLTSRAPLVLVCTLRPLPETNALDRAVSRLDDGGHIDLALRPLTASDSEALLKRMLKDDLPEDLKWQILSGAGGNPFHLEEIAGALRRTGIAPQTAGIPGRLDHVELVLPDSLQNVLAERIGRLENETRIVLQTAAAIGRVVPFRVLGAALPTGRGLGEHLLILQREDLVREHSRVPEHEYIFKHHLTQKTAYESIPAVERQELHRRVALALEHLYAGRLEEQVWLLAYHWELTEDGQRARHYLHIAADRARRAYANVEAVDYYRRALKLWQGAKQGESVTEDGRRQMALLYEGLGDVLSLTGLHEEACAAFRNAIETEPAADPLVCARLHRKSAATFLYRKRCEEALQVCDSAEENLGRFPQKNTQPWWQEWIDIQLLRIDVGYWMDSRSVMATLVEEVSTPVERFGTPAQRFGYHGACARTCFRRDRYMMSDEALGHVRAGLEASRELDNLVKTAEAWFLFGFVQLWRGELAEAEHALQSALTATERTGDVVWRTRCLTYLTSIRRKLGRIEDTRHYASQSLAAATEAGMSEYAGMARANLAWVSLRQGKLAEAEMTARAALDSWREASGIVFPFQWAALWPLVELALAQERIAAAPEHVRALLDPSQQGMPPELSETLEAVLAAMDRGSADQCRTGLHRALSQAREAGYL